MGLHEGVLWYLDGLRVSGGNLKVLTVFMPHLVKNNKNGGVNKKGQHLNFFALVF